MAAWFIVSHRMGAKSCRRCVTADEYTSTIGDLISKDIPAEWETGIVGMTENNGTPTSMTRQTYRSR